MSYVYNWYAEKVLVGILGWQFACSNRSELGQGYPNRLKLVRYWTRAGIFAQTRTRLSHWLCNTAACTEPEMYKETFITKKLPQKVLEFTKYDETILNVKDMEAHKNLRMVCLYFRRHKDSNTES